MTETRECRRPGCTNRFTLNIRRGRNSGKAKAGREHTFQDRRRYCSDACRKLASKARGTVDERHKTRPYVRRNAPAGITPLSTVANAPATVQHPRNQGPQIGSRIPKMTFGGYTVVPDSECPGMYRVKRPNGSLTDMVNLTRARDAARSFADNADRLIDKLAA